MATSAQYSRGVRLTSSGYVISQNRPVKVCAITALALTVDTIVKLRDGGAAGAIMWEFEADNGASSPPFSFDPPLRFYHDCYVEISGDANSTVSLTVAEP